MRVQLLELTHRNVSPADRDETELLLQAVGQMTEANPMLGMRGCRLGLLYPAIYAMQVRAILGAASDLAQNGVDIRPEIMIPLVGHVNELKMVATTGGGRGPKSSRKPARTYTTSSAP